MRILVFLVLLWGLSSVASAQMATWSTVDVEELRSLVSEIRSEGLDPVDYDHADLKAALASGNSQMTDRAATAVFMHLAADLSRGHVKKEFRRAWYIPGPTLNDRYTQDLLTHALSTHRVKQTLLSLLPRHSEYVKLKAALAATPARDKAGIQRLRANMERWRWMPRDLGRRYILVNVPAFEVVLVDDGKVIVRHKVIVGKQGTPTPQFAATVTGVQFNPSWYVPPSIVAESVGKLVRTQPALARSRGYVQSKGGIVQRPGRGNSLGEVKLVMPNPYKVYLHDTPSKALFDEEVRAFSHGCIRTQHALDFSATLLGDPRWNRQAIDRLIATRVTKTVPLSAPIPVYIAYFTSATDESGEVASYPDIYSRDGAIVASLVDRETSDF